jgi:hypothetical protein
VIGVFHWVLPNLPDMNIQNNKTCNTVKRHSGKRPKKTLVKGKIDKLRKDRTTQTLEERRNIGFEQNYITFVM